MPVDSDDPVGNLNWCDAAQYCAWAGKRLCGKIGGGPLHSSEFDDASKSEWFAVCSVNGTQAYSYPGTYDAKKCFTDVGQTMAVGSRTSCAGAMPPYSQVFDMCGNAIELDAACDSWPPTKDTECRGRGGEWGGGMASSCAWSGLSPAGQRSIGNTIRCCKDAL
jgi:sulfatase modifying factor 1